MSSNTADQEEIRARVREGYSKIAQAGSAAAGRSNALWAGNRAVWFVQDVLAHTGSAGTDWRRRCG